MNANSPKIVSKQDSLHPKLSETVEKHLKHLKSYKVAPNVRAISLVKKIKRDLESYKGLVLDTGCGTGESTFLLSKKYPEFLVVGIDKSILRINKAKNKLNKSNSNLNVFFCRENLVDFWLALSKCDLHADCTYILYPNPWPKKKHLKRRWHGHPVFPFIVKSTKKIVLRSNWKIYVEEFVSACKQISNLECMEDPFDINLLNVQSFISLFEKKFYESNHELYEVVLEDC